MAGQHLLQGRSPVEQHRGQRPDVHDLGRDGLHPQPGKRPSAGELFRHRRRRLHQPLGPQRARLAPRAVLARGRHQGKTQHPDHGGRPALHRDHGRLRADKPHEQPLDHHPPQRRSIAPERHRPRPDEGVPPGRGRGLHPPAHGRLRRLPRRHHGPLQPGAGHRPHGHRPLRGQAHRLDLGGRDSQGQTPQARRRPLLLGDRLQPVAPRAAPHHQHHQPPPADREHRPAGRGALLHDGAAQRHERAPDGRPDRAPPVQRGHQERRAPQEDQRGLGPAARPARRHRQSPEQGHDHRHVRARAQGRHQDHAVRLRHPRGPAGGGNPRAARHHQDVHLHGGGLPARPEPALRRRHLPRRHPRGEMGGVPEQRAEDVRHGQGDGAARELQARPGRHHRRGQVHRQEARPGRREDIPLREEGGRLL